MRSYLFIFLLLVPSFSFAAQIVDVGQLILNAKPLNLPAAITSLGQDVRRGVEARVQLETQPLLDVSEPLADGWHHYQISVVFIDKLNGNQLIDGQVAARTFPEDRRQIKTVRLEPQELQWTGQLILPSEQETMIKIGSKLSDGKKRIYRFFHGPPPVINLPDEEVSSGPNLLQNSGE